MRYKDREKSSSCHSTRSRCRVRGRANEKNEITPSRDRRGQFPPASRRVSATKERTFN